MADVDHPKTHVENQEDVTLPREQPESPKHEGIDPLTEGDTMYPNSETKAESTKLTKKQNNTPYKDDNSVQTNADQEERDAKANTPDDLLPGASDGSGKLNDEPTQSAKDGKLPKDAQIANKVGSDRGNTSPSNKPATQNKVNAEGTDTPTADGNERGAADPKASEPAKTDAPKSGTDGSKTSSR